MADKLIINTDSLSRDIRSFDSRLDEIASCISQMRDALAALGTMWAGPSHDIYDAQFRSDCDAAEELVKELRKFSSKLEDAGREYRNCSSKVDGIIDSLRL